MPPIYKKQVQTYLRFTGLKPGYLVNAQEATFKEGGTRCVNGLEDNISSAQRRPSWKITYSE